MQPEFNGHLTDFVHSLTRSYEEFFGESIPGVRETSSVSPIVQCWQAPGVIVAHDGAPDPVMVFGNQTALDLWEMDWVTFLGTPSRYTAEEDAREERHAMLAQAQRDGFYRGYRGIRVSATGRRFRIEDALIWNVLDLDGSKIGQAATFDTWLWL